MNTTLVPPFEEWKEILNSNRRGFEEIGSLVGKDRLRAIRHEVVEAAREHTTRLAETARRVVGATLDMTGVTGSGESPIVMAGHQPVIYHQGLLEKTRRLSEFAHTTGALPINIVIDTDEGDGGRFLWPRVLGNEISLRQATLSTGASLYREQRVASVAELVPLFEEVRHDLWTSGLSESVRSIETVSRIYQALSGESLVVAHAIARMAITGGRYLELPLSRLIELPTIQGIVRDLFADCERFVSTYNATLEAYREEHKIKNPANPFPNMGTDEEQIEMPFWSLVDGVRSPVKVSPRNPKAGLDGVTIAPRGSIVTLLLRGLCSDLFIHGLGGGKYDRFVDAFARSYWGVVLPRFVVASATRYLFPAEVERYTRARDLKGRYKEMISHTERFFGAGLFSEEEEGRLRVLVERRRELLVEMGAATTPDHRSRVAHGLNAINRSLKEAVDTSSLATTLAEGGIADDLFARWACREFPFFLFP